MSYIGQTANPGRGDNPGGFPRPTRRARPVHFAHDIKDTTRALLTQKHVEKDAKHILRRAIAMAHGPCPQRPSLSRKDPQEKTGPCPILDRRKTRPMPYSRMQSELRDSAGGTFIYPESTEAPRARSH